MFTKAMNTRIKDSAYYNIQNTNHIRHTTNVNASNGLDVLHNQVATNAISNIGGRADDPKCHPGTRVEVIGLIERWMDASEGVPHMFWLSGPAGAGKTAIAKTVTERCKDRDVYTANFFFFRGDSTRNLGLPLVATLVYQILQFYPAAHDTVAAILSLNPLILRASIEEQFDKLIHPLFDVILKSSSEHTRILLIIDGLDECDSNTSLDQVRIVQALGKLATRQQSPFRILIASRPEARIQMALNQLPSRIQSIFLDNEYLPEGDIRHFVNAEFDKIKSSHPSAHSLPDNWPPAEDVEDIVAKSSGQFIYAATVMNYIGHASTVPSLSLERVKGVVPAAGNSPFAHLDSIYAFILSQEDDLDATRTILGISFMDNQLLLRFPIDDQTSQLDVKLSDMELLRKYDSRYTIAVFQSWIAKMSAIVRLSDRGYLYFYHASMVDFLLDQSRAGIYWIDTNAFEEKAVAAFWENASSYPEWMLLYLRHTRRSTAHLTHLLLNQPFPTWAIQYRTNDETGLYFIDLMFKLYYEKDVKTYKRIVCRFVYSSLSSGHRPHIDNEPYAREYLSRYIWWFKLINFVRGKKWKD